MSSVSEQLIAAVAGQRGSRAADRLCEACVQSLGVDHAAICLVMDGVKNATLGVSDPRARDLDQVQFVLGEGPCQDAVTGGAPFLLHDLTVKERDARDPWPVYRTAMESHGIRALFVVPVAISTNFVGALDLFRGTPGKLSEDQLAGAFVAANLAGTYVLESLSRELRDAADGPDPAQWTRLIDIARTDIDQATGVLMAQLDLDADSALARLRSHAYVTDRSASSVAQDIVRGDLRLADG